MLDSCNSVDNYSPIFIVGVPRSGTTLLRVLLDSHPNIACGPESPWLARGEKSIKALYAYMTEKDMGFIDSFNIDLQVLNNQFANFIDGLYQVYAAKKGKKRWAEKTPDNSLEIQFLSKIFPNAFFVHIVRDGRDVACSTAFLSTERKNISEWHSKYILMNHSEVARNTIENASIRWQIWTNIIEESLNNVKHSYRLRYEDLVLNPEVELMKLMTFIGEEYSPDMMRYSLIEHEYPEWEWGSRDVKRSSGVSTRSVRRWEKQLDNISISMIDTLLSDSLIKYGYTHSGDKCKFKVKDNDIKLCDCRLGSVLELESTKYKEFMNIVNLFGSSKGLRTYTDWSKVWEYPWLWYNSLMYVDWVGKTVVDLGSEISPIPWFLAAKGASVILTECDSKWVEIWEKIKSDTGLNVSWRIVQDETLPFPDNSIDIVTSFSVIEHQPDKIKAIDEVARVLRNGGLFALSFDVCEVEMGLTFPEWNGKALTMKEFETILWNNPKFNVDHDIAWNIEDIEAFVQWHLRSAEHHNYSVAACFVHKR